MGLNNAKDGRLLYHLTELSNLPSILEKGLQSRRALEDARVAFEDVADHQILAGRHGFGLEKYIPFHFHPYSAFDKAVQNSHREEVMIYICLHRDYAKERGFKILPRHPLAGQNENVYLYDYEEGFRLIDWDILMEVGSQAVDAKNIKMAECLSDSAVPAKDFHSIAVSCEENRIMVENIMQESEINYPPPYINICPRWFI